MRDEWILLVNDKEYGPVDFETLIEWKAEGRVLPENPAKRSGTEAWSTAAEIPALFGPPPLPPPPPDEGPIHHRTVGEIIGETFRLYGRGFLPFFLLALVLEVPLFLIRIGSGTIQRPRAQADGTILMTTGGIPRELILGGAGLLVLLLLMWAFYIPAIQVGVSALLHGRRLRFFQLLREAARWWLRVLQLCLMVYGAYVIWSVLPLVIIFSLLAGTPNVASIFLVLLLLALQVYMTGRLFIGFMFWQQCAVLENRRGLAAIRESRTLAWNRVRLDWRQRPLFRGALIASLWLIMLIVGGAMAELPFVLARFGPVFEMEQAIAELERLARRPDSLMMASYVSASVMSALLKPLLGIAFVVLFHDARADFPALDNEAT